MPLNTSNTEFDICAAGTSGEQLSHYELLLSSTFGNHEKFSKRTMKWRYADNPHGSVVGWDAFLGNRLVAHYATIPVVASAYGRAYKGLLSLNTATAPEAQGRGLFTKLAERTYVTAKERGYDFVIGVANANSTGGFIKRLSFQLVSPLSVGFVWRYPDFSSNNNEFEIEKSQEWLAWRLANPAATYSIQSRSGTSRVGALTHLPGVSCVAYLRGSLNGRDTTDRNAFGVSMFIGLEPSLSKTFPRWVNLPTALRPSPLNLIYRRLGGALPERLTMPSINFLDFDAY